MKQQNKWLPVLVIGIIAALAIGVYFWKNQQNQEWTSYQNTELGFAFKYPEELGELSIQISETDLNGTFSGAADVKIGGISKEYSAGRGSYYMDFIGFKNTDGNYFFESVSDRSYAIEPKKIINDNVILVDCMSFEDKCIPQGPTISVPTGQIAGLINLPNKVTGMVLIADEDTINESTMIEILSSLTFLE